MNKWNFSKIMLLFAFVVVSLSTYAQNSDGEIKAETDTLTKTSFSKSIYVSGDFGLGILDGENTSFKLGYNGHLGIGFDLNRCEALRPIFYLDCIRRLCLRVQMLN